MQLLTPNVLSVVAYAAFAPISWSDEGRPAGRDIAFLRRFAAGHGLALQVRFAPFDQLWALPGRDVADLAAAGIAQLPERAAPGVIWSEPYFTVQRALLVRAVEPQLRTIDDFAGRTVAVTRGSTAEEDVLARKPSTARVLCTDDQAQALVDLAAGRIDAYATGDAGCHYLAKRSGGQFAVADVHPFRRPEQFAFALRAASGIERAINSFIAQHREQY